MKILKKIQEKIIKFNYWCYLNIPIFFDITIFTILSEWWQARSVYKFPHISVNCYKENYFGERIKYDVFSVVASHLMWKWKEGYIAFEHSPKIIISILNKYYVVIYFNSPVFSKHGIDDHLYWESMLNYLYMYNKNIIDTYDNWGWETCDFVEYDNKKYSVHVSGWNWDMIKYKLANKLIYKVKKKKCSIFTPNY